MPAKIIFNLKRKKKKDSDRLIYILKAICVFTGSVKADL